MENFGILHFCHPTSLRVSRGTTALVCRSLRTQLAGARYVADSDCRSGVGVAVAATVAVDVWSRAVSVGGVAFKATARVGGRDRTQQQQHSMN